MDNEKLEDRETTNNGKLSIDRVRPFALFAALIIIWIVFQTQTNGIFMSVRNLSNLSRQMAITAIIAIGMVQIIIATHIDLSVGATVALSGGIIAILTVSYNMNPLIAVLIAMLAGGVIGIVQGYWVAYRQVPAFIVTLGGQMIIRGVVLYMTRGTTIPIGDPLLLAIGTQELASVAGYASAAISAIIYLVVSIRGRRAKIKHGFKVQPIQFEIIRHVLVVGAIAAFTIAMNAFRGIPYAVVALILLVVFFTFMLKYTQFGRQIYAIGGNNRAARYSGINVRTVTLKVFIINSLLSAFAGFVLVSRLGGSTAGAGMGFELDAIAACIIGGTSFAGGKGTVAGAMLGALIMASIDNGMSLMNAPSSWQLIIRGSILIVAVWFDIANKDKAK